MRHRDGGLVLNCLFNQSVSLSQDIRHCGISDDFRGSFLSQSLSLGHLSVVRAQFIKLNTCML